MTRKLLRKKLNNKKGFTLVEVLAALLITIIVLGVGMVALIHYSQQLKLMEMDSTAKEIFVAAQNHLTASEVTGQAKSYVKKNEIHDSDFLGVGALISDYKPNDYSTENFNWPDPNNEYYYLVYTPKADTADATLSGSFLKYLLPFGAIDEEVRTSGSYVIEYNPTKGNVYGVFYTDNENPLTHGDIKALTENGGRADSEAGRNVRRNYTKYDKNVIVGYYGGAMADELEVATTEAPTLKIINEDVLAVEISDPNYFKKENGVNFASKIVLTIKGKSSKATAKIVLELDNTGKPITTGNNMTIIKDGESEEQGSLKNFKFWKNKTVTSLDNEKSMVYRAEFDNITKSGQHFADIFTGFIPGEDIMITATCDSNKTLIETAGSENPELTNSLFESIKIDEKDPSKVKSAAAKVSYIRHIENLDEKVSEIKSSTDTTAIFSVKNVEMTSNMNWNDYFGKGNYSITATAKNVGTSKALLPTEPGTYFPIKRSELSSFNGNGYSISDVVINNEKSSSTNNSTGNLDGGLFRLVTPNSGEFSIENLVFKNFDVFVKGNAAVVFGETKKESATVSKITMSNILIENSRVESKADNASASGLFGYCNANNLVVNDCAVVITAINSSGGSNAKAAGLAGTIKYKSTFTNCYSGGQTENGKYSTENYNVSADSGMAGGFVALLQDGTAIFNNCYSTCSVSGEISGGFIGNSITDKTVTFNNCYSAGLVAGTATVGCFCGNVPKIKVEGSTYYLSELNDEEIPAIGGGSISGTIEGKNFNEMKEMASGTCDTHNVDKDLDGREYPFKTVNKTGLTDNSTASGVHYGDWEEIVEINGTNLFAYRETMEDESVHWSILGATLGENDTITVSNTYNNLVTGNKQYVKEYDYGVLSKSANINNQFTGNGKNGAIKDFINTKAALIVSIAGEKYYFYPIKTEKMTGVSFIVFPEWKMGTGSSPKVTIKYNPGFANAMCISGEKTFGTNLNPYKVRSETQFKNINNFLGNKDIHFNQTCDIKIGSSTDAAVISGTKPFTGNYNGNDHTIINNSTAALFGELGSEGTISNLNIEGSIKANNDIVNIGSLVSVSNGTIEKCKSKASIEIPNTNTNLETVGGLIGVMKSGKVILSNFTGSLEVKAENCNVGGLVGSIEGEKTLDSSNNLIDQCYSKGSISCIEKTNSMGGFIGSKENYAITVSNCYGANYFGESMAENPGIFVGYAILNDGFLRRTTNIKNCCGIELNEDKIINLNPKFDFITKQDGISILPGTYRIGEANSNCLSYQSDSTTITGVYASGYKDVAEMCETWGSDIWKYDSKTAYPMLINNKEK